MRFSMDMRMICTTQGASTRMHTRSSHTHTHKCNRKQHGSPLIQIQCPNVFFTLFDSRIEDQSPFALIEHISRSKVRGGTCGNNRSPRRIRDSLHNSLHLRRYLQIHYRSIYMIWSYRSELPLSHTRTPLSRRAVKQNILSLSLTLDPLCCVRSTKRVWEGSSLRRSSLG